MRCVCGAWNFEEDKALSLVAVGHATSLILAVTFALCVNFDLLAGYWFFAEPLKPLRWAGVLTIIAGIYLTSVAAQKTRQASHSARGRSKKSNGENSAERHS